MIPGSFDYHSPTSIDEALALLGRLGDGAKILAGGQSLIPAMRFRLAQPEHLIDLNRIAGLEYVREEKGHLAIGALTRESALETSAAVQSRYPLLADTARVVADPLVVPTEQGELHGGLQIQVAAAVALEDGLDVLGVDGVEAIDSAGLDPVSPATPLSALVTRVSAPLCRSTAYTSGMPSQSEMKYSVRPSRDHCGAMCFPAANARTGATTPVAASMAIAQLCGVQI